MVYIEYEFYTADESKRDFIISLLPEVGFDGFEELDGSVKAFIPKSSWDEASVLDILAENQLSDIKFQCSEIEPKNWNEEWEKNFEPIMIAGISFDLKVKSF